MKHIAFMALLAALTMFSCRKLKPAELPENGKLADSYLCSNGVRDNGEESVDCGGPNCSPCLPSQGNCSLPSERYVRGTLLDRSFPVIRDTVINNRYMIIASNSQLDSFYFTFSTPTIDFFKGYNTVALSNLSEGSVHVKARLYTKPHGYNFFHFNYHTIATVDAINPLKQIHFNKQDGKILINFCELSLYEPTGGSTYYLSGNLTSN